MKMQMQPTLTQPSTDNDNQNRREKSISDDSFSFPSTPNNDSDFEFGSLTPDSPSSSDPCKSSPADHLFFNGRLQPHSFPVVMFQRPIGGGGAITTSRTSSISSKGSLLSSRSNSTNSRSSCSSSARTSSSDTCERKLFHNKVSSLTSSSSYGKGNASCNNNRSKVLSHNNYAFGGSSKRWQYIITPVPVLSRDASKRSIRTGDMKQGKKKKKKKMEKGRSSGMRLRFGGRILRWFVMACRECHAMEPSKAKNKEIKERKKNVNNNL